MEQGIESRNSITQIWPVDFLQRCKGNFIEKEAGYCVLGFLQQMRFKNLDSHVKKKIVILYVTCYTKNNTKLVIDLNDKSQKNQNNK